MFRLSLILPVIILLLLSSRHAMAEPRIFFERAVVLDSLTFQAVAANSQGEYFVLNSLEGTVVKLDNDLNEVLRFPIPAPDAYRYSEIAVDTADTVWISQGRFSREKPFLSFDRDGNHTGGFVFRDRSNTTSSNAGIAFDSAGNVHFIVNRFQGGQLSCWLTKVDPATGRKLAEWLVFTDGPYYWHRGLVIDGTGNFLWGNFSSRHIYDFTAAGEQFLFSSIPSWSGTHALGLGDDGTLYALEDPTYGHALYVFGPDGEYQGKRPLDIDGRGAGVATYRDEIVVVSMSGSVVKYTSLCEASAEYPDCISGVTDMVGLVDSYISTGDIGTQTSIKLSLELQKAAEALAAGDVPRAIHHLEQFKNFAEVKTGNGLSPEAADVLLLAVDSTINSLL